MSDDKQIISFPQRNVEHPELIPAGWVRLPWDAPVIIPGVPSYRGVMRGEFTTLSAQSDPEAVKAWLDERASDSRETLSAYRKEAERLMLWASAQGKCLSDLSREDYNAYWAFLADPGPGWISGPRRWSRSSVKWRPFSGPLSETSIQFARRVIRNLVNFLVETGWFRQSPLTRRAGKKEKASAGKVHSFSKDLCVFMMRYAEQSERPYLQKERLVWLLVILSELALRISDVVNHSLKNFGITQVEGKNCWTLKLVGKGNKAAELPVPSVVVMAMSRFREALGLAPYPAPDDPVVPLSPDLRVASRDGFDIDASNLSGMSRAGVYKLIKDFLSEVADELEYQVSIGGERIRSLDLGQPDVVVLRKAGPHTFRHTALKRLMDETKDPRMVQQLGRHSSLSSSEPYIATEFLELMNLMEAWSGVMRQG